MLLSWIIVIICNFHLYCFVKTALITLRIHNEDGNYPISYWYNYSCETRDEISDSTARSHPPNTWQCMFRSLAFTYASVLARQLKQRCLSWRASQTLQDAARLTVTFACMPAAVLRHFIPSLSILCTVYLVFKSPAASSHAV
jgi:hypothetical protein